MRVILIFVMSTLALAALVAPPPARAAHPLRTDDAGTLGRGAFQLELGAARSRDRSRQGGAQASGIREDATELSIALGAGLRDDLDLTLGAPYTWSRVAPDVERERVLQGGEPSVVVRTVNVTRELSGPPGVGRLTAAAALS